MKTRGEPEQRGDLALGPLLGARRRRSGRGSCSGRPGSAIGSSSLDAWRARACRVMRRRLFFFVERAVLAAIQTATPTRAPMPTSQANRPSETGPSEPRVKPPYVGRLLGLLQVGDDVALVLGGEHLVGEDRHLLRAGEHGLVDVLLGRRPSATGRTCRAGSAPPAPAKLWQAVQLVRKNSPPRTMSSLVASETSYSDSSGTAGPGPSEATNAASASISSSL